MKRLLLLTPEPIEGASSRLRAIDLQAFWRADFEVTHLSFLSTRSYLLKDQSGHTLKKVAFFLVDAISFIFRLVIALPKSDCVFLHRNISPIGPPLLEALIKLFRKPLIYDFDDAIYLNPSSARNQWLGPLKMNAYRTDWLCRHATIVLVGNEHLAAYAKSRNPSVEIVPTGLDLSAYSSQVKPVGQAVAKSNKVIGWIGSAGTEGFVQQILPVLYRLLDEFPDWQVQLIGASFPAADPRLKCLPWRLEDEIGLVQEFSIGINPLELNEFTKGKCGFKNVQYQASGVVCVSSPVGVCAEQIEDGVTGLLATTHDDWYGALRRLMQSSALRAELANAAQPRAERYDRASVASQVKRALLRAEQQ